MLLTRLKKSLSPRRKKDIPEPLKGTEMSPFIFELCNKCNKVDIFIPIIALFYLNKILVQYPYKQTKLHIKLFMIVSLKFALKYYSDVQPSITLDFGFSQSDINKTEWKIFKLLDFNLSVTPDDIRKTLYCLYYYEIITKKKYLSLLNSLEA